MSASRISLCLIARDESAVIDACLRSVADAVDPTITARAANMPYDTMITASKLLKTVPIFSVDKSAP